MTSRGIILTICWILMILSWTTAMFPGSIVPLVCIASFFIMEWTGMFKKELMATADTHINNAGEIEDALTNRQKDFIKKMQNSVPSDDDNDSEQITIIKILAEDGSESAIFIKDDGEVTTEGDPDPEMVNAAKMLHASVIEHGPEAIAKELDKQFTRINKDNQ